MFSLVLLSKYIKKFLSKFYKMEMPISSIRVPKPFSLSEPLKAFFLLHMFGISKPLLINITVTLLNNFNPLKTKLPV